MPSAFRRPVQSLAALGLCLLMAGTAARAEPTKPSGGAVESFADPGETGPAEGAGAGPARTSGDAAAPRPRRHRPRKPKPPKAAAAAPGVAPAAASAPTAASGLPVAFTDWRALDPAHTLVIDTSKGRIVVELRPDMAPASVERVEALARRGTYDGLLFHRVIDGFVDQTGNPNNHDGGKTELPNLPPEFTFRLGADIPHVTVARPSGDMVGFIGATPYESVDETRIPRSPDHRVTAWGAYCAGVMGMGRDAAPDSGNSEIFFMRDPARRLDRDYTVVGRVVFGLDVVRAVAVGEPPAAPDRMIHVSVLADMAPEARPKLMVLNTQGAEFRALVDRVRAARGADFSVCDIEVPVKAPDGKTP